MTAPLLRAPTADQRELASAYDKWRQHFETCPVCHAGDWYGPDFKLRPCRVGRVHFRRWQARAVAYAPSRHSFPEIEPLPS